VIEFEGRLEWANHLDDIYGPENWLYDEKTDDGFVISYYRTKQFTKSFKYDPRTYIGEV